MKRKLTIDVLMNTAQVLVNQLLGVIIFIILSRWLDKGTFGEFNWCMAILVFATTLLSLRLEEVIVRDVAAGDDVSVLFSVFMIHNLVAGFIFLVVLSMILYCWPSFDGRHPYLWLLALSQLLILWSMPFRKVVTGRGAFSWLALLSTISNLVRAGGLFLGIWFSVLDMQFVVIVFILSALAEWLLGTWIVWRRWSISFRIKGLWQHYKQVIKKSVPQLGLVFLTAGIARMDWILMGVFSTAVHTAEYSFAYRAYEFSPLPLLVLAPFLLNRFAGSGGQLPSTERLDQLVRIEMILACLPTLWMVLAWNPVVDAMTGGKYGTSNYTTFLILSCCIPFQYLINIYWTAAFSRNKLSVVFRVTAITAVLVIAGDALVIPHFAGAGAATVLLAGMVVQYILYTRLSVLPGQAEWPRHLLTGILIAGCCGWMTGWIKELLLFRLLLVTGLYFLLARVTGLIRATDTMFLRHKRVYYGSGSDR